MSQKKEIDACEYHKLLRNLRINGIKYTAYSFISIVVNCACAAAFYYIEHCVSMVPASYSRAEQVIYETCGIVNAAQKNDSALLRDKLIVVCERERLTIENMRRRECKLTGDVFSEWLVYVYVVGLTIGRLFLRRNNVQVTSFLCRVSDGLIHTGVQ